MRALKALGWVLLVIFLLTSGLWVSVALYLGWKMVTEIDGESYAVPQPIAVTTPAICNDDDAALAAAVGYHVGLQTDR